MRYIKKYNESKPAELNFESYKDIILSVLDNYNYEYEFLDMSSGDPEERFYDCQIELPESKKDVTFFKFDYLSYESNGPIPYFDGPEDLSNEMVNEIELYIDRNVERLRLLRDSIDIITRDQNNFKNFIKDINQYCLPIFKKYDECFGVYIGLEGNRIRITYEISNQI